MTEAGAETKAISKDTSFEPASFPVKIESPGRMSAWIIPVPASGAKVEVSLPPQSEWDGEEIEKRVNQSVEDILPEIHRAVAAMSRGDGKLAVDILREARTKHPKITYLKFLQTSAHLVAGDRTSARELLEEALQERPEFPEGERLRRSLAGESRATQKHPREASSR